MKKLVRYFLYFLVFVISCTEDNDDPHLSSPDTSTEIQKEITFEKKIDITQVGYPLGLFYYCYSHLPF